MKPLGRSGADSLEWKLDQRLLVALARDLLIERGHLNVRVMDGPGDGMRDIHSLSRSGVPHITQCKHHEDPKKTASSRELAELPLAMQKFKPAGGSSEIRGLFVTDGRISPQAKSEFVSLYDGLSLEFLDRESLLAEVLASPILSALWVEDATVRDVPARVQIPVILRRMRDDRPIRPESYRALREALDEVVAEYGSADGQSLRCQHTFLNPVVFGSLRMPQNRTAEQGAFPVLHGSMFELRGRIPLESVYSTRFDLPELIAQKLSDVFEPLAVIAGIPEVVVSSSDWSPTSVSVGARPVVFVGKDGCSWHDSEWFFDLPIAGWFPPTSARATENSDVRLYNSELDATATLTIAVPPNDTTLYLNQRFREGWYRSIFALVPDGWRPEGEQIPHPNVVVDFEYEPDKAIWYWLHPKALGGLIPTPRDVGEEENPIPDPAEHPETEREMEAIRSVLKGCSEVQLVPPERARHMIALTIRDPLPDDTVMVDVDTGNTLHGIDTYPKPVDPRFRHFAMDVAWELGDVAAGMDCLDGVPKAMSKLLRADLHLRSDDPRLVVHVDPGEVPGDSSTRSWVMAHTRKLASLIREIESRFESAGLSHQRCTAKWWNEQTGFDLKLRTAEKVWTDT